MTVTIAGEIISPTDTTDLEHRLMGANVLPIAEREALITNTLEQSAQMLNLVTRASDPARFAAAGKSAAEMASHYAKRLDISKDAVLDAQVMQRRWERALGLAIREGQERGTIRRAGEGGGDRRFVDPVRDKNRISPKDFFVSGSDAVQTYTVTDNVTDAEFDAAMDEARAERNVSRANVVRKIKEANGTAPVAEPRRTGDPKRAGKQVATFKRLIIRYEADEIVYGELTRAGLDPAITDQEAREIIAGIDRHIRDLNKIKKSLA